jgi:hypothetical protein
VDYPAKTIPTPSVPPQAEAENASVDQTGPGPAPDPTTVHSPTGEPAQPARRPKRAKPTMMDRIDAFVSRLSTKNNFWHRVCSMIWLPYAFKSGIQMKRLDDTTFRAVLPFRRFNRNWYNAMAGAALLGNSEIAGGSYVFGFVGADYTVVCKHLEYTFKRPCFGPAEYRITPREDIAAHIATGKEFNITLDMDIVQLVPSYAKKERKKLKDKPKSERTLKERLGGREKRVGHCAATFHVTPKQHQKDKGRTYRA